MKGIVQAALADRLKTDKEKREREMREKKAEMKQ